MLSLDDVYKTRIPESHAAGLQAVYDYALAQAAEAFLALQPVVPIVAEPVVTAAVVDPVI